MTTETETKATEKTGEIGIRVMFRDDIASNVVVGVFVDLLGDHPMLFPVAAKTVADLPQERRDQISLTAIAFVKACLGLVDAPTTITHVPVAESGTPNAETPPEASGAPGGG